MARSHYQNRALGIFAPLFLFLAGCGKPTESSHASVRGTISFHGHPLTGGTVVFAPDRERGTLGGLLVAEVGENGSYKLLNGEKSVPSGWYRIAIAEPPEWYGMESTGTAFPTALRRPDKSGLEREVLPGKDYVLDFPIELTQ